MRKKGNNSVPEKKGCNIDKGGMDKMHVSHKYANIKEGKQSWIIGNLLFFLYGIIKRRMIRSFILNLVPKLEGGLLLSLTIRKIFFSYHNIDIGLYSQSGCFVIYNFSATPPMTTIGRYCSIANTVHAFNANHPMNLKSSNAIFFNPKLGYSKKDILTRTALNIGNDVWIGHNAIIMPTVSNIGDGAVIGAGALVYQDVPPYAVIAGVPGQVVRKRFPQAIIDELQTSKWWEKSLDELLENFEEFQRPLVGDVVR